MKLSERIEIDDASDVVNIDGVMVSGVGLGLLLALAKPAIRRCAIEKEHGLIVDNGIEIIKTTHREPCA
jgi:hypothetical protein